MSVILPLIAGASSIVAGGAVLYRNLRPRFPIHVNCWFCGEDSTVPYGNQNCWDCPHCDQYNGFAQDGDYNKPIPAQYTEHLNHPVNQRSKGGDQADGNRPVAGGGGDGGDGVGQQTTLCEACSRNQLLKVKQLANFVPYNELTYSMEVEAYEHHLEQVYRLCRTCQLRVQQVLHTQHRDLGIDQQIAEARREASAAEDSALQASMSQSQVFTRIYPPWPVLVLRLAVVFTAAVLLLSSVYSLIKYSDLDIDPDNSLPEWITVILQVIGHKSSPLVMIGLFATILAIFLFGSHRVHHSDALACFAWLVLLLLQSPRVFYLSATTPLLLPADLRLLQAMAGASTTIVSLWALLTPRYEGNTATRMTKYSKRQWLNDSSIATSSVNSSLAPSVLEDSASVTAAHNNNNENGRRENSLRQRLGDNEGIASIRNSPNHSPLFMSTPKPSPQPSPSHAPGAGPSAGPTQDLPGDRLETMSLGPPAKRKRPAKSVFSYNGTSTPPSSTTPGNNPWGSSRRPLIAPSRFSASSPPPGQGQPAAIFNKPPHLFAAAPGPSFSTLTRQNVHSNQSLLLGAGSNMAAAAAMEDDRASLFSVPRSQHQDSDDESSAADSDMDQSDSEQVPRSKVRPMAASQNGVRSKVSSGNDVSQPRASENFVRSSQAAVDSDVEEEMEDMEVDTSIALPNNTTNYMSLGYMIVTLSLLLNVCVLVGYLDTGYIWSTIMQYCSSVLVDMKRGLRDWLNSTLQEEVDG